MVPGAGASLVVVKRGARGAWAFDGAEEWDAPGVDVAPVDVVGAGDAFAAMIIRGILASASPSDSLRRAADFAARFCGLRGAGVADLGFYSQDIT